MFKETYHNHDKYITTGKFNKFAAEDFDARLARVNLVIKTDFDTKLISLDKKTNSSKTFTCWKWIEKAENIWFELFYWQKSFRRRWHTKLLSISANA